MKTSDSRMALLLEMHKAVADAAKSAVESFGTSEDPSLSYPPGVELSSGEREALSALELDPEARAAVVKVLSDACSYPLFHLCTLLDGVADPYVQEVDDWVGGKLEPAGGDSSMLHDEFYESYWEYADSS